MLSLTSVSKKYGKRLILDNVTQTLRQVYRF